MIYRVFTILIIFEFETIICRILLPNNQPITSNQCYGLTEGTFPHHSNCTLFIECDHGKEVVKPCGPGTGFDRVLKVCNFYDHVPECSKISTHEQSTEKSINQNDDRSENKITFIPLSRPNQLQWNTDRNQQFINNNLQSAGFDSNYALPPSQHGHDNSDLSTISFPDNNNDNYVSTKYGKQSTGYKPQSLNLFYPNKNKNHQFHQIIYSINSKDNNKESGNEENDGDGIIDIRM